MKAILLSFVFIYFSEFGLFKELRPIQNKKIASTGIRAAGCERGGSNSRSLSSRCRVASRLGF
jgi:hypothetical protein